jgi:hypothetical protein
MTAGQGPYGDPAGQSGASGQPDPQSWGAPPGQPPYGQSPYGQSPYPGYGAAPSAPSGYGAPAPVERPVSVRAGIGAFVGSIVISLVSQIVTMLNLDALTALATADAGLGDLSPDEAEMATGMVETFGTFGLLIGLLFTGIFALFVWFAWRGHNWSRIVLWVLAGLGLVGGLIGAALSSSLGVGTLPVLTFLSWVEMLLDAAGIVFLALKPSNEWYRYRGWLRATGQPG